MKLILAALAAAALSGAALAEPTPQMGAMDHATPAAGAQGSGAQGSGVVRKIDLKEGTVTLQHGPIVALNWPAMTMTFKADPALLKPLRTGQAVTFTVSPGDTPQVTAIQPR